MEIPEPNRDIMVTFNQNVYSGLYGEEVTQQRVTKRGFYSSLFNHIAVPPGWRHHTMGDKSVLLPHGWGGDKLSIDQVIRWEYCE